MDRVEWFWSFPLLARRTLAVAFVLVAVPLTALILLRRPRIARNSYVPRLAIGGVIGLAALCVMGWLLGNVFQVFGDVTLSQRVIGWAGCAGAVIGVAITASLTRGHPGTHWWHHGLTVLAVAAAVFMGAVGINREYAFFLTPKGVADYGRSTAYPTLSVPAYDSIQELDLSTGWSAPADMPATGTFSRVTIPATVSGFKARQAMVYLPPAALVTDPPQLPVIIALSGQPGTTVDMFTSGGLLDIVEAYQSTHDGLAPIVVSPDQLGSPDDNPMCADSDLGENETYLVTDVLDWIHGTLPVDTDAAHTALIGFSQGGTCVTQLGFGHPDVFGNLVPISPEEVPTMGDDTVDAAFHGDEAAYQAIQPLTRLAAHGPYQDLNADFYVGEDDADYVPATSTLSAAATAQNVHVTTTLSPGTAHDYYTVQFAVTSSFPQLISRFGLPA